MVTDAFIAIFIALTSAMADYIFWIGLFIVFYTYIGYAMVLACLVRLKTKTPTLLLPDTAGLPAVTLVIAAYNEEKVIQEKIRNTIALEYPPGKLKVIFVTDGSTDRTPEMVRSFPDFTLFHEPQRRGKIHAVNRVMKFISSPITVFCDANTFLNKSAIRIMVRHYQDENVGGVAGEKRISDNGLDDAPAAGEGVYWKYESFLKRKDAELHSAIGAAGELFSIRTDLYEPPPEDTIIEDFYLSMKICERGYRFAYEPNAFAVEGASATIDDEWKRKVRICAGAFQAMARLRSLLNPVRHGILSFQYFSHRVLRWTLAPLSLPLVFLSNIALAWGNNHFYTTTFIAQLAFYSFALLGYLFRRTKLKVKAFFVPYYFVMMNAAVYTGFSRYLRGRQSVVWERSDRAEFRSN